MSDKALRYNEGKVDYTYLEPELLKGICAVMEYGASKYTRDNWKNSINKQEHQDYQESILKSLMRHAFAIVHGEELDEETKLHHIYHVATNCMFYAAYMERGKERPEALPLKCEDMEELKSKVDDLMRPRNVRNRGFDSLPTYP